MRAALRIALLAPDCRPVVCGVGDYTLLLAKALGQRGVETVIWTRRAAHPPAPDPRPAGVISVVRTWRAIESARFAGAPRRWRPDLIHLQYEPFGFHFRWGAFGGLIIPGGLRVVTLHEPRSHSNAERRRQRTLVRLAHAVVVTDDETSAYALDLGGPSLRVVKIGIGSNVVAEPQDEPLLPPGYLLWHGIQKTGKGLELLLEAYVVLRLGRTGRHTPALVIAGAAGSAGYAEHVRILVHDRGIEDAVHFIGEQSERNLATLLRDAAACVLPFPEGPTLRRTTLHAAWRAGCPVVTVPPRVESDRLRSGVHFLSGRDATADGLAEAMATVLDDAGTRASLARGGLELAQKHSWELIARTHLDLYRSLLRLSPNLDAADLPRATGVLPWG